MNDSSVLLTTADVAKSFTVSRSTVNRWARDGLIPVVRTPGGGLRFRREDVERFLAGSPEAATA